MDLLADETVVDVIVYALRADGHDVSWMREDAPVVQIPTCLPERAASDASC